MFFFSFYFKYLFIFRERGGGREKEREKNTNAQEIHPSVASHMSPTWDPTCNSGMCPDWDSNQRPLGSQSGIQSTESHQPGCSDVFVSRAFWKGLWCRPISDAAYDWPRTTCLELKSDLQLVAASAGPGYVPEGSSCAPQLAFTSTRPGSSLAKFPWNPDICLCLGPLSEYLLGSVTDRASGYT